MTLPGEFDVSNTQGMRDAFLRPEVMDASVVDVDCRSVTFLDSSAIGVLVSGARRVRATGGEFSVSCDQGGVVHQLLVTTGFIEFLGVKDFRVETLVC